jgi:hypothetical protein
VKFVKSQSLAFDRKFAKFVFEFFSPAKQPTPPGVLGYFEWHDIDSSSSSLAKGSFSR